MTLKAVNKYTKPKYTLKYILQIFDLSDYDFPNDKWIIRPTSDIIIKVSCMLPIVLFGLLGNAALFYIICKYKHLRTPTNLIIANMAIADFINLLFNPWIFLVVDFFQNYQLGEFGCKVEGWLECKLFSKMSLKS